VSAIWVRGVSGGIVAGVSLLFVSRAFSCSSGSREELRDSGVVWYIASGQGRVYVLGMSAGRTGEGDSSDSEMSPSEVSSRAAGLRYAGTRRYRFGDGGLVRSGGDSGYDRGRLAGIGVVTISIFTGCSPSGKSESGVRG
jgi:hypothetical protein